MIDRRSLLTASIFALIAAFLFIGCSDQEDPDRYVARVGDRYLMQKDVERQLTAIPVPTDSAVARQQIIEQWITNELLYQEAQRRGLQNEDEVKRLLEESERAVLVNALLAEMYDEGEVEPTPTEMQSYYERHKEQLRLREGFVRVRYLETRTRENAETARNVLDQAAISARDSVWADALDRFAVDVDLAREISEDYFPESRIFAGRPVLRQTLGTLREGQVSPVLEGDSTYVVIQLAERVAPETIPEPAWIEDELARRLVIQGRKQLYARQVQRLRNEALAREDLEVR